MFDPDLLITALEAAVPLHIAIMRDWTDRHRVDAAYRAADVVAERGDVLMFGGGRGDAAEAFNWLAKGLAAAAYQPGGVTFAGRHWCTDHALCVRAEAA